MPLNPSCGSRRETTGRGAPRGGAGARPGRPHPAGGNIIGDRTPRLGDHVQLGATAVVAGDVTLGDRVVIGAGAVVVKDFAGPGVLVGVPAHPV